MASVVALPCPQPRLAPGDVAGHFPGELRELRADHGQQNPQREREGAEDQEVNDTDREGEGERPSPPLERDGPLQEADERRDQIREKDRQDQQEKDPLQSGERPEGGPHGEEDHEDLESRSDDGAARRRGRLIQTGSRIGRGNQILHESASAPARAHRPSWSLAPPETPMAPAIRPSITSGMPPSMGIAPARASTRSPSPPAARTSWKAFVGRRKSAAERALSIETRTLPICVSSIFSK